MSYYHHIISAWLLVVSSLAIVVPFSIYYVWIEVNRYDKKKMINKSFINVCLIAFTLLAIMLSILGALIIKGVL